MSAQGGLQRSTGGSVTVKGRATMSARISPRVPARSYRGALGCTKHLTTLRFSPASHWLRNRRRQSPKTFQFSAPGNNKVANRSKSIKMIEHTKVIKARTLTMPVVKPQDSNKNQWQSPFSRGVCMFCNLGQNWPALLPTRGIISTCQQLYTDIR